ncbi:hypothetical protein R4575_18030 [Acinetobacter baumannii]|nr:hypothetical protein [Acinetobacter baumannii]
MTTLILMLINLFLEPFVFMTGWNGIVCKIFDITTLNYVQSLGLTFCISVFFAQKIDYIITSSAVMKVVLHCFKPKDKEKTYDEELVILEVDEAYNIYKLKTLIASLVIFLGFPYFFL